jgi:hypothetical protein
MTVRTAARLIVVAVALLAPLHSGTGCAAAQESRPKENSSMTTTTAPSHPKLTGYLTASTKYNPTPVPLGLPRDEVIEFLRAQVTRTQTAARMRKLLRLAALYDANEAAPTFASILLLSERETVDFVRSAIALTALGWIGDDAQRVTARDYFCRMMPRAPYENLGLEFAQAAFVLDDPACTTALREWAQRHRNATLERADKEKQAGRDGAASTLRMQVADIEEFLNIRMKALEADMGARKKALSLAPAARAGKIADTYLEIAPEATPRLSEWAAWYSLRASKQQSEADALIAAFLKAAQRHEKTTDANRDEFNLARGKALRAAALLGGTLTDEQRKWLEQQEDLGTDILALRPSWKYGHPARDDEP